MKSLLEYIDNSLLTESAFSSKSLDIVLGLDKQNNLPVDVVETKWKTLASPERLARVFKFNNFSLKREFINQILKHQEKIGHHSTITITHKEVRVELYTHDVDAVTELDTELAHFIDQLYDDLKYYIMNAKGRSI